jgi:hypothetical protein
MLTTQISPLVNQSPAKVLRRISFIKNVKVDQNLKQDSESFEEDSDSSSFNSIQRVQDSIDLTVDFDEPLANENILSSNVDKQLLEPTPSPVVDEMIMKYSNNYNYPELTPSESLYASLVHLVTDLKQDYSTQAASIELATNQAIQASNAKISKFEQISSDWRLEYDTRMTNLINHEVLRDI